MNKKIVTLLLAGTLSLGVVGCKSSNTVKDDKMKVCVVLDEGGANDQSFNQSAIEGLYEARDNYDVEVSYIESAGEAEYITNIESAVDLDCDLVVAVGYKFTEEIEEASKAYPDQKFAIIDGQFENETPSNVVPILFDEAGAGYAVGLIASQMTETNKVAFLGGYDIPSVTGFMDGFIVGVKEGNSDIEVKSQFANSFTDAAKGKAMAQQLIKDNYDIIFSAAGGVNQGVWEASTENNKMVIGVDMASSHLSDAIITSAVKNVGTGLELTIKDLVEGNFKGGEAIKYDLSNGGVGYETTKHLSDEVIKFVEDKIN